MAYLINNTDITRPQGFDIELVEDSATQVSLVGRVTKDIFDTRNVYILRYEYLTKAQYDQFATLYNLRTPVTFEVTETNAPVSAVDVHMELSNRVFRKSGADYRVDVTVKLIEVNG